HAGAEPRLLAAASRRNLTPAAGPAPDRDRLTHLAQIIHKLPADVRRRLVQHLLETLRHLRQQARRIFARLHDGHDSQLIDLLGGAHGAVLEERERRLRHGVDKHVHVAFEFGREALVKGELLLARVPDVALDELDRPRRVLWALPEVAIVPWL